MPKINVSGEKELLRMFKSLAPKEMKTATRKAIRVSAKEVLADAKALVPTDTGTLESALTVRVATKLGRNRIGSRVITKDVFDEEPFYGHFVEFGTVRMPAQPYLRPALYRNEDEMRQIFTRELRIAIDHLKRKT
jgi:HK97 gp10 family phage protein